MIIFARIVSLPRLDDRTMPLQSLIDRASAPQGGRASEPSVKEKLLAGKRCLLHVAAISAKKTNFCQRLRQSQQFFRTD
jgi:hypothetical protein